MSRIVRERRPVPAFLGAVVLLAGALSYFSFRSAEADHQPADKVAARGSTVEVFGPEDQAVELMSATMRTSNTSDLIFQVSAECSITTNVETVGNDSQKAEGTVEVFVTVDGQAVSVAGGDDGHVTFCNRMYRRDTLNFNDEDATIRTFFDTKTANAFNWVALDVGSGVHTIAVNAVLTTDATQKAFARAGVGNRTLVVEPTHFPNDASLS